jgi:hypothetical protein
MMSNEVQNSLVELARESGAVIQIHEFTLPDGGISRGTVTFSMDALSTFADKVRAEEREKKTPFDRMADGEYAKVDCEEAISKILGTGVWLSFDDYDGSFEIFPSDTDEDIAPTEEQNAAILALGCSRYWINFPDGSQRYMRGERRTTGDNRWERHNNFAEAKRSVEERIRAEEREACALVCESAAYELETKQGRCAPVAQSCAASIRDRKE